MATMTISMQWVLNFANAIVGVGMLTMPYCYQQCGIILATMMIVASGHLTKVTCEFLLRAGSYTRKSTYETLALLIYGNTGKLLCEISTIGVTLGTLVAFQVVIGDLAPAIVTGTLGFQSTWLLRAVLMIASCGLILPLCLMRSVSSLASLNTVSMTFYAFFIFVVCCLSLPSWTAMDWWIDVYFWKPENFFKCLPIILLAYNCQAQVFIFYGALPDPNMKTMIAIIHKAINLVNMFYVTVGLFGYIAFYKAGVHGDVMENFPSGFLTILMKLGFLLSVVVSFPLMCFPVRSSLNSLLFSDKKQGILHDVITNSSGYIAPDKFVILTLGLVSSTLVIGILVPKIEVVLSITGALAGSFISLVFPAALFVMAGAKDRLRNFGLGVLLLSSFFMITCTSSALYGIMGGEPAPLPQQSNMKTSQVHMTVKTELPLAKIATVAPKIDLVQSKILSDVKEAPKVVVTPAPVVVPNVKLETGVSPLIPQKVEEAKVEEKKVVPNVAESKPDAKQMSELEKALHGNGGNANPTHPPAVVTSAKEVMKVEELGASGVPTQNKVAIIPKTDLKRQPLVAAIKGDSTNKESDLNVPKVSKTINDPAIGSLSLKETPLQGATNVNGSEKKVKVNREILSKA